MFNRNMLFVVILFIFNLYTSEANRLTGKPEIWHTGALDTIRTFVFYLYSDAKYARHLLETTGITYHHEGHRDLPLSSKSWTTVSDLPFFAPTKADFIKLNDIIEKLIQLQREMRYMLYVLDLNEQAFVPNIYK